MLRRCYKCHVTLPTSAWQKSTCENINKCEVRPIEHVRNGSFMLCAVLHEQRHGAKEKGICFYRLLKDPIKRGLAMA